MSRLHVLTLGAMVALAIALATSGGVTWSAFSATTGTSGSTFSAASSFGTARQVVTPAYNLRDASSGTESNASLSALLAGDGMEFKSAYGFPADFSTAEYLQSDSFVSLPAGLAVADATHNYNFKPTSGTACIYMETRRASTDALLATHGSAANPLACNSSATSYTTVTTALPEVTSTDIANDLRVRTYMTNTALTTNSVDISTVTGTQDGTAFSLPSWTVTDTSQIAYTANWALGRSGDQSSYGDYLSAAGWDNAFASTKYLKLGFPAYVPTGATGVSATFKHAYASNTTGTTTCWYFEVYNGATLLATHGSASAPVSCTSSTTPVTDTVALPSVDTVAEANNLTIKAYLKNDNSKLASRKSRHDLGTVTIGYTN